MATKVISILPSVTTLVGSDVMVANASGVTSKIRFDDFLTLLGFQAYSDNLTVLSAIQQPSGIGLSLLVSAAPSTPSFLKAFGTVPIWRTPSQVLGDIGGQATSAGLSILATLTPSGLGQSLLTATNSTAVGYLRVAGDVDQTIFQYTPTQVAAEIRPYLLPPTIAKTTSVGAAGTFTPDLTTGEIACLTAQSGAFTIAAPSGSPYEGQRLIIRVKDDGTGRAITWNAIYRDGTLAKPSTTVASKTHYMEFVYNVTDTKWDLLSLNAIT